MEQRFLELAKNKDITDEEFFEELRYMYAKHAIGGALGQHNSALRPSEYLLDINTVFKTVKEIRERNPTLDITIGQTDGQKLRSGLWNISQVSSIGHLTQTIENYEMKKRIQSLEQTLATFMEQTKVERLSQEAVMQSLSNELDEFQEEFYDCQSEVKEQKERIDLLEDALKETLVERIPFVKDKTD
jgi:predicted RNase H-like nuclease (RuvC/YqgF family)